MLGLVLLAAERLLEHLTPPLVGAALIVAVWKIVTGGIHLDGLADCLDGLAGPDAVRRRVIMQDSRIGVFGAAGLVLVLLLFVASVFELPPPFRGRALLLAPVVGRVSPLLAGAWLPPATPGQGLGGAFVAGLTSWAGRVYATASVALATWLLGSWGAAIVAGALCLALLWARFAAGRFAGITGDVLGAVVEASELAVVLLAAVAAHRGVL